MITLFVCATVRIRKLNGWILVSVSDRRVCLDVDNPCLVNKAVSTCKMCILKWRYKKKYNRPDKQGLEKGFLCPRVDECGRRVPAVARYLSNFTLSVRFSNAHVHENPFSRLCQGNINTYSLWGRGRSRRQMPVGNVLS